MNRNQQDLENIPEDTNTEIPSSFDDRSLHEILDLSMKNTKILYPNPENSSNPHEKANHHLFIDTTNPNSNTNTNRDQYATSTTNIAIGGLDGIEGFVKKRESIDFSEFHEGKGARKASSMYRFKGIKQALSDKDEHVDKSDIAAAFRSPGLRSPLAKGEIVDFSEYGRQLSNREKLEILRQLAPRFSEKLKLWPLFDGTELSKYSLTFHYYYKLYGVLFKLMGILMLITLSHFILTDIILDDDTTSFWITVGYSIVSLGIIRIFKNSQENKILEDPSLQQEDWTQHKFAVFIQGIDPTATKEEIKRFLEEKIQTSGYQDKVHEIMFLQDCRKYKELVQKLRNLEYEKQKKKRAEAYLMEAADKIQALYDEYMADIDNFKYYKGNIIVLFETIRGKLIIENYFNIGYFRKFLYFLFSGCCGKRYRFKKSIPKVTVAYEPTDIIFENLHIPPINRILREFFVTSVAVSLTAVGIVSIIMLKYAEHNNEDPLQVPKYVYSIICVLINFTVCQIGDVLIKKVLTRRSVSSKELERVNFRLSLSFLNLNVFYGVLLWLSAGSNEFDYEEQLWITSAILMLAIPIGKAFSFIDVGKICLRRKIMRDPHSVSRYSQKEIIDIFTNPTYDFATSLEDLICYMFLTMGFYIVGGIPLVLMTTIGMYLSILIDKAMMRYFTGPPRIKGAELGLELFSVLRWDIRVQAVTLICLDTSHKWSEVSITLRVTLAVLFILLAMSLSSSLLKKWKNKWNKERETIKYTDVEKYFPHTYQQEYPFEVY